jgi:hypothetical protein
MVPVWVMKFREFFEKQKRVDSTYEHLVYYRKVIETTVSGR